MSNTDFDVCIRGSGIVGRALALKLGQAKLRVALVDNALPTGAPQTNPSRDIRAYALNHSSRRLLESLRCWPEGAAVTAVQRMQVQGDKHGSVQFGAPAASALSTHPTPSDNTSPTAAQHAPLAWIVDVPTLEDILSTALRFQSTVEVVAQPVEAPLTAICEGKLSTSRAGLGITAQSHDYPQHAIATRVKANLPHGGCARQWFTGPHIVALLPLRGDAGDEYAVVWSTSVAQADQLQAMDDAAFAHALQAITTSDTAPPAAPDALPSPALAFTVTAARARWPLRLSQAAQWSGPMPTTAQTSPASPPSSPNAWVLLGDAAHTVHPLAGSGLNLGLGDVESLSTALLQRPAWRPVQDPRLLRHYERERKAALLPYAATTDGLQWLFWQEQAWLQTLRNWGMRGFSASGPFKNWVIRQAMNL